MTQNHIIAVVAGFLSVLIGVLASLVHPVIVLAPGIPLSLITLGLAALGLTGANIINNGGNTPPPNA